MKNYVFFLLISVLTLASCDDFEEFVEPEVEQFTVTFNTEPGTEIASQTIEIGKKVNKPADPTNDGFSFDNWYTDAAFTTVFDFTTETVTGNTTLFAKWILNYTVTFNSFDGTDIENQTIKEGEKVNKPEDPTKDGFILNNWYSDAGFSTVFDFENVTIEGDITLYAEYYYYPLTKEALKLLVEDSEVDVSKINTSNITDMSELFRDNSSFNGDISGWNVSNVTDMSGMFFGASNFNQDIGLWDVANVTDMSYTFRDTDKFNQDIGNWNVANVTNMRGMFYSNFSVSVFNQDIGSWDVGNVTSMAWMFRGAASFNQDIGSWDVSNVLETYSMFSSAASFDQDISSWNISKVNNMTNMFFGNTALSQENYDTILIGWGALPSVKQGVAFNSGGATYCLGEEARQKLINDYGWEITDGGKSPDCSD